MSTGEPDRKRARAAVSEAGAAVPSTAADAGDIESHLAALQSVQDKVCTRE